MAENWFFMFSANIGHTLNTQEHVLLIYLLKFVQKNEYTILLPFFMQPTLKFRRLKHCRTSTSSLQSSNWQPHQKGSIQSAEPSNLSALIHLPTEPVKTLKLFTIDNRQWLDKFFVKSTVDKKMYLGYVGKQDWSVEKFHS